MLMLSDHISLSEMIVSQEGARLGIDNNPHDEVLNNLKHTAQRLEEIIGILGKPVIISSGYRSPILNLALRGDDAAAHCQGYAVDFLCPQFGSPLEICRAIARARPRFDRLGHEFGQWCHISFDPQMRRELFTARHLSGENIYEPGLSPVR